MYLPNRYKGSICEAIRFVVVGGISFAIDLAMLVALQEAGLKNVHNGILFSTTCGFLFSLVIHYFLTTYWVFNGHAVRGRAAHVKAGTLFAITNGVGCLLNNLFMYVGVTLMALHYIPVKFFATVVVMIWNFGFQKFIIYRKE